MQVRMRWDMLYTEWLYVDDKIIRSDVPFVVRIPPPVDWHFDKDMIYALEGRIAVESTLITIEFQRDAPTGMIAD